MIAVAVAAMIMTARVMHRRQKEFQRLATYHEIEWRNLDCRVSEEGIRFWLRYDPWKMSWEPSPSGASESVYHTRMWEKYQRAARYPWLPVEPDPPLPE
jgi:hypothetical protein